MKRVTLLLFATTLMISCGKNQGEKMLYEYQLKNAKSLNFDLKDLNFKIQKVEKVADIKTSDSLRIIEEGLSPLWEQVDPLIADTLKFEYLRLVFIGSGACKGDISELKAMEDKYIELSRSSEVLLTAKYRANYTMNNPILNAKQTFDEFLYTDSDQTEFVKREENTEGK